MQGAGHIVSPRAQVVWLRIQCLLKISGTDFSRYRYPMLSYIMEIYNCSSVGGCYLQQRRRLCLRYCSFICMFAGIFFKIKFCKLIYFGIPTIWLAIEHLFPPKMVVSEMTYTVSSGTLNSTIPYYTAKNGMRYMGRNFGAHAYGDTI